MSSDEIQRLIDKYNKMESLFLKAEEEREKAQELLNRAIELLRSTDDDAISKFLEENG